MNFDSFPWVLVPNASNPSGFRPLRRPNPDRPRPGVVASAPSSWPWPPRSTARPLARRARCRPCPGGGAGEPGGNRGTGGGVGPTKWSGAWASSCSFFIFRPRVKGGSSKSTHDMDTSGTRMGIWATAILLGTGGFVFLAATVA